MIETILISLLLVLFLIKTMKRPKQFPPGPSMIPGIGNLNVFFREYDQTMFRTVHRLYGQVVGLVIPRFRVVVVSGWEAIKEALSNDDLNGRPDACLLRDRFNGGRFGLVFQDGPDWRTQKRFALHHFRNLGFGKKAHEMVVLEEVESLVKELDTLSGVPIFVTGRFALSAINIIWCLLGGKRYDRSDAMLHNLTDYVKESMRAVNITGGFTVIFPALRYMFPTVTGYKNIKNGSRGILKFVQESLDDHQKTQDQEDFIGIYLKELSKPEKDESFSISQLEALCVDFLSAASDTSSSVLGFAIMLLCQKQELQEIIYKEIELVVGNEKLPTSEDRPRLVYTDAFLSEVLRYRTVTPTFPPHRAMQDTNLLGYKIPKNTVVLLNYESVTTDKTYWGDPEIFRPERFITEDGKLRKDERLITFGKGKRSCLGETLARLTVFLILAAVVQRFTFRFPEGEIPMNTEGVFGFTLAPPEFRVIVVPRNVPPSNV